ncbi:MAG TPA: efflux RND transporter permease subunit [Gammaproteobacteria bacterium]
MTLPELSIRRHVLAYMFSAVIVLFGLIAYSRIGVDRFPNVEFPMLTVTTAMPGASPEVIDQSITNVLEASLNGVPGINHISSTSSPGAAVIIIMFEVEKDIDVAFNEVQAKLGQVARLLPDDALTPVVAKADIGAAPIMWLALQGDRTQQDLNRYANNIIKKRLENISGVGGVLLGGKRDRNIRVELDLSRLNASGLTTQDLLRAFASEHIQMPGGFMVEGPRENLINLDLEFHSVEALGRMVVGYRKGHPIRLQDVATLRDDLADYRQLARFDGQPTVGIGIIKISNANTVAIVNRVQEVLDSEIVPQLPAGMKVSVASNQATMIQEMVFALQEHLLSGTLLAALIVWLFLKNLRSTMIIAIAIPISLLGAVAAMYFVGYTFNSMTLLALLLLIGVVVDDAIVVLENVYRHREKLDPNPLSAALNGTNEVVFAVFAASLTLVSIFAPVIFLGGIVGRFLQSFAVVVTVGVLVSLFVSMTLTPMLCSRYLQVQHEHGRFYRALENIFLAMESGYRRLIGYALLHRWKIVLFTLATVLSSGLFFSLVGKAFVPPEDEGRFMVIFKTPLGSSIDYTNERLAAVEKVLASHKEVASYFSAIGLGQQGQVNQGTSFVNLVPRAERDLKQYDLMPIVQKELAQLPGVIAIAAQASIVGGQRGEPLQFILRGQNLDQLGEVARKFKERLDTMPELGNVDMDLQLDLPQLDIELDRTRAAALGLSAVDIGMAINVLGGGYDVAKYNDQPGDGERYNIRLKAADGQLQNPADLRRIYLRSQSGQLVRLDSVMKADSTLGPAVIGRFDLQYSAIYYSTPTVPLGAAVEKLFAAAAESVPPGFNVRLSGQAEEFKKMVGYMAFAFGMAIVLVYMVLASQFNSFLQPLVIMAAQPLAIIGGVISLWLSGNTLNIYSMIGMVLLIGLVAKNSILLVDLTNQYRREGMAINEALREACPIRLRPVLMTSFTVILALLPAALGFGAGSDTNGPLAVAIIGGMFSSTLLTLVVVPAIYSLVEGKMERRRAKRQTAIK